MEDRKQVWLGWVWIQPRGNKLRESWTSKISSSPRAATVSLVPSCLGTMRVVMENVSTARSSVPAKMPQLSMLREVFDFAYLQPALQIGPCHSVPCGERAGRYGQLRAPDAVQKLGTPRRCCGAQKILMRALSFKQQVDTTECKHQSACNAWGPVIVARALWDQLLPPPHCRGHRGAATQGMKSSKLQRRVHEGVQDST